MSFRGNKRSGMRGLKSLIVVVLVVITALVPRFALAERQAGSDEIGARDHKIILARFGGEIDDPDLSDYVSGIGLKLVAATDERSENWTFTILDSPVVNAFALPGGYVYITRGLLAIANNEAELAGVLGHEIGHVISGHGEDRIKRENRAGLGVILGTILGGVLGGQEGAGDAIELGARIAGGYLSSHSKAEEFEADKIGVRLLVIAGYDPFAQARFLDQLAAKEALERRIAGQAANPNRVDFFASHPATGRRIEKAIKAARKSGLKTGDGVLREEAFLEQIDGIVYGDTTEEGFVRGLTFSHPEMGFTFSVPEGFILQNTPQRVIANNNSGARMVFSGEGRWTGSMDLYITRRWVPTIRQQQRVSGLRDVRNLSINGLESAMAMLDLATPNGPMVAQLTAIRFGKMTVRIVALSRKSDGRSRNALNTASQSFRALSESERLDLRPFHLRVIRVTEAESVRSLADSMPLTGYREETFKAMNGYTKNSDMRPGDLVKIIE